MRWRRLRTSVQPQIVAVQPRFDPETSRTTDRRRIALAVLLLLSFLAVVRLAAPVWVGIVFGLLMAFTMQPLHIQLESRLHGRHKLAALLTAFGTAILSLLFMAGIFYGLTSELTDAVIGLQQRFNGVPLSDIIGERGHRLIARFGISEADLLQRIQLELGRATGYVSQAAGIVLETTTTALLGVLIGCITMYYALVEWTAISTRLEKVMPLDPRHTRALVLEFREVGRSALLGLLATAAVQAVLAAVAYAVLGLPRAFVWGILTGVASFIPVAATATIWIPVSIYFFLQGSVVSGVLMLVLGVFLITGFGEYVLRPRLVGGGKGKGQPLLMLVAALGGIQLFGLPGIVAGPVMMSLFLAILRIYEREIDLYQAGAPERLSAPAPPLPPPMEPRSSESRTAVSTLPRAPGDGAQAPLPAREAPVRSSVTSGPLK
ncbi:MAG TPA: AI-2E family transporter [Polyangiaceae bacterium]|jgi:predicted PurR-regulated permease PerM|nr:AI-2E family transporter [Polyangiaceae bacterium]